jgi:hypothetical protein
VKVRLLASFHVVYVPGLPGDVGTTTKQYSALAEAKKEYVDPPNDDVLLVYFGLPVEGVVRSARAVIVADALFPQ